MNAPMTPERMAEIRQRDAAGEFSLTTAADRRELLAEADELLRRAKVLADEKIAAEAEVDRLRAQVAELDAALRYSNQAREIMRDEKERGWREAEKHESRAELAEAEAGRLRAQACCLHSALEDSARWLIALAGCGPDLTVNAHKKAAHEALELAESPSLEEVADVSICLVGVAVRNQWTVDQVAEAIHSKNQVNESRSWFQRPDGTWQHRTDGDPQHDPIARQALASGDEAQP